MQATKTKLADMRYVLSNLSAQFQAELARGNFTIETTRSTIKSFIKDNCALTLSHGDTIVAILGYTISDNIIYTAFPSTPDFFKVNSVRFGTNLMNQIQENAGNLPIESHSYTDEPKVEKWYKLMGFHLKEEKPTYRIFRLDPKEYPHINPSPEEIE